MQTIKLLAPSLLSALLAAGMGAPAQAQTNINVGDGWYDHASTYAEGVQRGFADVVRSAGAANLMNSEAAQNYEAARSQYFDNRLQWTQTYFEMRQINRQARQAEALPRLSSEQLFRIAAQQAPTRLTSSDVDPLTGDITWPIILEQDQYEPYRTKLQSLFVERSSVGGAAGASNYLSIQQTAQEALNLLRSNIANYPSGDYIRARRFLESLAFTARTPTT